MNIITSILNYLPKWIGDENTRPYQVRLLVVGMLCTSLVAILGGISNIDPKLALMIDSVHLPANKDITVGEGSVVCYEGVPADYITFNPEDDGTFSWQIDSVQYQDTLMYFKVNDANPQKHTIVNDPGQIIHLNIPGGPAFSVTGRDIFEEWNSFTEQQEVLLRHFAARYGSLHLAESDSMKNIWEGYADSDAMRSFLSRRDDVICLVILDRYTRIEQDGHTVGYRYSGRTAPDPATKGRCKVQFFAVSSHSYKENEFSTEWFQIDTINYVMKPSVLLTGWGAGHVMLDARGGEGIDLHYPKSLGYVGTLDSLRSTSRRAGHVITFRQQGVSFPTRTDIYLPQISSSIPLDLCSLELNDSTLIRDNDSHLFEVTTRRLWGLPISVLPVFHKVRLHSGDAYLDCRVGIIDFEFAFAYLVLPTLVALLLILLVVNRYSCLRANKEADSGRNPFYSIRQLGEYPYYMTILILVALCYAMCKSLITLKLSYTYPYFEKLTAISPVSTSLFVLLFFTFAMVLNTQLIGSHDYQARSLRGGRAKRHSWRKWIAWGIVAMMALALAYVMFEVLDEEVSCGKLSSYFDADIYSGNPFHWREIFGINDNHRSVPYAELLVEAVLLAIWLSQNIYWQFDLGRYVRRLEAWLQSLLRVAVGKVQRIVTWLKGHIPLPTLKVNIRLDWLKRIMAYAEDQCVYGMIVAVALAGGALFCTSFRIPLLVVAAAIAMLCLWASLKLVVRSLFPWRFLLLVVLVIIGKVLGNFGTAFITLIVIFGLSRALTSVTFAPRGTDADRRHSVFFQMIILSLLYIIAAMPADNGYITNYVGILTAVFCFYYVYDRNTARMLRDSIKMEKESRWTMAVAVFAIIFALLLPFACSYIFDPGNVDYNRLSRRVILYADYERQQASGYRYSDSDTEFMSIMSHYMQMKSDRHQCDDPLCNEGHFLHPSVSTGQSPVVLNDLSVPAAFIGGYGVGRASAIFFLLLLALLLHVVRFSFAYPPEHVRQSSHLTYAMQWRLLALFMWVGTSYYIYLSYIGFLPFTGRLIQGYGVDSVGEALESALLLGFMAGVTLRTKNETDPTSDKSI